MNIIVVGAGKVGASIIENFINEKHDVLVIDNNPSVVESLVNKYDVQGIVGSGIERDTLIESGVERADFFIACTSRDEMNVLCSVLAKKLGAKHTVARVRTPEYFNEIQTLRKDLGLDMIFNPEYDTSTEIANLLKFPSSKSVDTFSSGKAVMVEFEVEKDSVMADKTIVGIAKEGHGKVLIALVNRGGKRYIPKGDFVIKEEDRVFVISTEDEITSFCKSLKIFKRQAKNVIVIGGGMTAFYLAKGLASSKTKLKIIENDLDKCKNLVDVLDGVSVVYGNGTDEEVLLEEGLNNSDACIAITGNDEENVIVSLYAKQIGVPKVITKVVSPTITNMLSTLDLDSVISPKSVVANRIIKFVRSHQVLEGSGMNEFYKLDGAEAIEFLVGENFNGLDTPIKNLKIKRNVLIGGIIRDDEYILPTGDDVIKVGDKLLIVTTITGVTSLSDILS